MSRGNRDRDQFRSSDFNTSSDTWDQRRAIGRTAEPPLAVAPVRQQAVPPSGPAKPDPRACPGGCNSRYREAWKAHAQAMADYDPLDSAQSRPEPPGLGAWPGEPVWCVPCTSKIALRLAQLDILAGILAAAADGHRPSGDLERVSGSAESPSPSQAGDDLDEMFAMLASWERIYRELKHWRSGPPRGELASRETECINWLQRHLPGILSSDIAADFGLEILQWHKESAGSAKAEVRTLRKPMRCPTPSCRNLTLFWTEGEQNVYCKNPSCGRILSLAEYEAEAERQAGILKRGGEDVQDVAS
jgi:hypothetical protein